MNDLVSVIIPVYNCEMYIRKCVLSILDGTYSNIEVILVNDGSTDNSLAICNLLKHLDNRVKVYSQTNQGPSAARNKGIELAVGDYLIFADADDEMAKTYVMDLTCLIHKKNAILGQVGYTRDINKLSHVGNNKIDSLQSCTGTDAFKLLWCGGIIDGYLWNKIFVRKRVVGNKICFSEETFVWEDSLFIFEYLSMSNGVCVVSGNKDYFYRENNNSITHHTESINMLDAKCSVIQKISILNQEIQGEKLNSELNKVKLNLIRSRITKLKPIKKKMFDKYENLIKTSYSLSFTTWVKAKILLFTLKCFRQ